jgi:hypothetical protein
MPRPRHFELEELVLRPGTYFNTETEVLIIVDDSPELDQATFDAGAPPEGGEWVLVSDEAPVDEAARDELLERFQVRYREGEGTAPDEDELDDEDEDDELEPDELDEDDEVEEL